MPQYEAIHSDERKKILWRAITARKKVYKSVLGLMLTGAIISLIRKARGGSKSTLFDNMDLHKLMVIILGSIAIFLVIYGLFYLVFRTRYKAILRKLQRKVAWNFIDIGATNITMRMDWDEVIITKDEITEIYFASEGEKENMISKDWDNPVDLNVLKIRTETGFHLIVLDIIQDADNFIDELHNFYPIYGMEEEMHSDDDELDD